MPWIPSKHTVKLGIPVLRANKGGKNPLVGSENQNPTKIKKKKKKKRGTKTPQSKKSSTPSNIRKFKPEKVMADTVQ